MTSSHVYLLFFWFLKFEWIHDRIESILSFLKFYLFANEKDFVLEQSKFVNWYDLLPSEFSSQGRPAENVQLNFNAMWNTFLGSKIWTVDGSTWLKNYEMITPQLSFLLLLAAPALDWNYRNKKWRSKKMRSCCCCCCCSFSFFFSFCQSVPPEFLRSFLKYKTISLLKYIWPKIIAWGALRRVSSFEKTHWRKVKQMQPMCIFLSKQFTANLTNTIMFAHFIVVSSLYQSTFDHVVMLAPHCLLNF